MSIIKFYKDGIIKSCKLCYCNEHIIDLQFEEEIDQKVLLSGFNVLNENNYNIQGEYSGYTTVFQIFEDCSGTHIKLSNDGSVYIPTIIEPEKIQAPTHEELETQFKVNKNNKIQLSKSMLEEFLSNNPVHSSAHRGTDGIYSVTKEKQSLMINQYMTYKIEKSINPDTKLMWNETGKSYEEWLEEEFLQLIVEIKAYVYPLVSYQQYIEENIRKCTNQEELDSIVIDYYSIE